MLGQKKFLDKKVYGQKENLREAFFGQKYLGKKKMIEEFGKHFFYSLFHA